MCINMENKLRKETIKMCNFKNIMKNNFISNEI